MPSTSYSYSVDAFDAAGNYSSPSSPVSVTTPAMPPSLTFTVGADTYVDSSNPTTNYGSDTVWRVDGSPDQHAYLSFNVQGLAGYPIQSAYLLVYANTNSNIGIDALSVADNSWDENTVTYDTAPALGSLLGSSGVFISGNWVSIDVSSYVTGESPNSSGVCSPARAVKWEESASGRRSRLNGVLIDVYAPDEPAGYPTLCKGRFEVGGNVYYAMEEPTSLNVLGILPDLYRAGVAAIKVEGRQRSPAYVAQVTRTLREAIDACAASPETFSPRPRWVEQLDNVAEGRCHTLGAYSRPWQ